MIKGGRVGGGFKLWFFLISCYPHPLWEMIQFDEHMGPSILKQYPYLLGRYGSGHQEGPQFLGIRDATEDQWKQSRLLCGCLEGVLLNKTCTIIYFADTYLISIHLYTQLNQFLIYPTYRNGTTIKNDKDNSDGTSNRNHCTRNSLEDILKLTKVIAIKYN